MKLSEIEKILSKCDIYYKDDMFSKEVLIQKFSHFIANTISFDKDRSRKKRAVILHTGSDCFDALLLVYLCFMCIMDNPFDEDAYIGELCKGDTVWYGDAKPSRYVFLGREGDTILLGQISQKDGTETKMTSHVPRNCWYKIRRYFGDAQTANTRGARFRKGKEAEDMMQSVFGKHFHPILLSAVVLCPRLKAEELMRSISIRYRSSKTGQMQMLALTDLVIASYYTTKDTWYPISQNPAKQEAVLQFVNDCALARKMLRQGSVTDNRKIGLTILLQDRVSEITTGLENLVAFGSRTFSILSSSIAGADIRGILDCLQEIDEDAENDQQLDDRYFICSKDYLLSGMDLQNVHIPVIPNPATQMLCHQIDRLIDAKIDTRVIPSPFTVEFCCSLHQEIFAVRHFAVAEEEEENKEQFVIHAFTLMKLFMNAVFPLDVLAKTAEAYDTVLTDCQAIFSDMQNAMGRFPGELYEIAFHIVSCLDEMQQYCTDIYGKSELLTELLLERSDKQIALIVPKKQYLSVLRFDGAFDLMEEDGSLHVLTPGQFTNLDHYDTVIAAGTSVLNGRFNIFQCPNTDEQIILLHPYEDMQFQRRRREYDRLLLQINRRSTFPIDLEAAASVEQLPEKLEQQVQETEEMGIEIDAYIEQLRMAYYLRQMRSYTASEARPAEAIMLLQLNSGEMMYLSEQCKLYVYDETNEKDPIREIKPQDLQKGDLLLVTSDYEETRDIVDLVHKQRFANGELSEAEALEYQMALRWKEDLQSYKAEHQLTNADIARELCNRFQLKKDPATVNGWLDPNSHTVHPQRAEDLQNIASLCNDEEMFDRYTIYYEACNKVLQMRKKIRKEIGLAIREQLCGPGTADNAVKGLSEQIKNYSELVMIEELCRLHPAEPVPYRMINRPI